MARKRTADRPPFNPVVIRWAREHAGLSVEDAANKLGVPAGNVADWENPAGQLFPTVRQARNLAQFYGRAFLEFFLPSAPDIPEPKLIPDFRLYRHADDPSETRELKDAQSWAETQRENALNLFEELGDDVPKIPRNLFSSINDDIERAAAATRAGIQFPIEQQIGLPQNQRDQIPIIFRDRIESLGILTLRRSDLKHFGVRGFCLSEEDLPVIVFASESPNAQAFTLGHELGHVILRQSAISGPFTREGGDNAARRIENWCNRFSGAFLIPRDTLAAKHPAPDRIPDRISDEIISNLAEYFGVSRHAMLIRLMHLGYVAEAYYWDTKKHEYDEEEKNFRVYGRPKYYGKRYYNSLGTLYTSLVIEAWNAGKITNHNAAEFMGIKNLAHMRDLRENFGS